MVVGFLSWKHLLSYLSLLCPRPQPTSFYGVSYWLGILLIGSFMSYATLEISHICSPLNHLPNCFHKNAFEPIPGLPWYLNLFIQLEWNVKVEVSAEILRYQVPKGIVNWWILDLQHPHQGHKMVVLFCICRSIFFKSERIVKYYFPLYFKSRDLTLIPEEPDLSIHGLIFFLCFKVLSNAPLFSFFWLFS